MKLTTGGAGLGMGLARALAPRAAGAKSGARAGALPQIEGPAVMLSGSCSEATLGQVEAAKHKFQSFRIDPHALERGGAEAAIDWARSRLGPAPILLYSSAKPEELARGHAEAIEGAFRKIARALAEAGVRRFVVAGGETSGAVVEALGVRALAIGPEIDPGVPWTASVAGPQLLLALKSGNFGSREFFSKAFEVLTW
jgi:uncharacterized protein YgbK (DUF1537 family)